MGTWGLTQSGTTTFMSVTLYRRGKVATLGVMGRTSEARGSEEGWLGLWDAWTETCEKALRAARPAYPSSAPVHRPVAGAAAGAAAAAVAAAALGTSRNGALGVTVILSLL